MIVATGTSLVLGGTISQTGTAAVGLTLLGAGPTELRGTTANTYFGTTTIAAGTLTLNQSAGVVAVGATLAGSGTVGGSVTVLTSTLSVPASGGTLDPGRVTAGSTARLNTGALALPSAATFRADLNGTTAGTGHDQVRVTGTVSLGGSILSVGGRCRSARGWRLRHHRQRRDRRRHRHVRRPRQLYHLHRRRQHV